MKRLPVLHPILFAAYSVLAIVATFPSVLFVMQAVRTLIAVVAGVVVLMLALRSFIKDWDRAGFLTTMAIIWLLYYGHIARLIQAQMHVRFTVVNHLVVFALWTVPLAFISSNWVWKRVRPGVITNFMNIISMVALLFPLRVLIMLALSASRDPLIGWTRPVNLEEFGHPTVSNRPDIYYIIVDGYGRADILDEMYGIDNSAFLDFLSSRGFYVAGESRSNYVQTSLSLSSSLNLEYLDYLEAMGKNSDTGDPAIELVTHSKASAFLKSLGYQTVAFATGFLVTEVRNADVYLSTYAINLNEFEQLWVTSTAGGILVKLKLFDFPTFDYASHRRRILYTLDELTRLPDVGAPRFVFAHIVAPHPPFVFDRNGQPIEPDWPYTQEDAGGFGGTIQEYVAGYAGQLAFVNLIPLHFRLTGSGDRLESNGC